MHMRWDLVFQIEMKYSRRRKKTLTGRDYVLVRWEYMFIPEMKIDDEKKTKLTRNCSKAHICVRQCFSLSHALRATINLNVRWDAPRKAHVPGTRKILKPILLRKGRRRERGPVEVGGVSYSSPIFLYTRVRRPHESIQNSSKIPRSIHEIQVFFGSAKSLCRHLPCASGVSSFATHGSRAQSVYSHHTQQPSIAASL